MASIWLYQAQFNDIPIDQKMTDLTLTLRYGSDKSSELTAWPGYGGQVAYHSLWKTTAITIAMTMPSRADRKLLMKRSDDQNEPDIICNVIQSKHGKTKARNLASCEKI